MPGELVQKHLKIQLSFFFINQWMDQVFLKCSPTVENAMNISPKKTKKKEMNTATQWPIKLSTYL